MRKAVKGRSCPSVFQESRRGWERGKKQAASHPGADRNVRSVRYTQMSDHLMII